MISQRHSHTAARQPSLGPKTGAHELAALTSAVRVAVGERADWRDTSDLVASALELHLPSPNILTAAQRTGDPESYRSEVLHAEPGDIHRVRNAGDLTAVSLHIYGTDVTRIGSSVRRYYELPARKRMSA